MVRESGLGEKNSLLLGEALLDVRAQKPFVPPQLQIFGFNSQLYNNFSDALHRAQGIVAVSLLLQVHV